MKKGVLIILAALLAGAVAFCWMRVRAVHEPTPSSLLESMPELAWLRQDLNLTDKQFAEVSRLHIEYRPKCVEMCERIANSHERMEAAVDGHVVVSDELKKAIEEHAMIHAECQEAMIEHLYRTAATLDEKQAERYLETMLPYALDFSHSEPENVHVR